MQEVKIQENVENSLWSISPIDGRYSEKTHALRDLFSEGALIKYRLKVELHWLLFLAQKRKNGLLDLPWDIAEQDIAIITSFLKLDCKEFIPEVKAIEHKTKHDVKALEYFLRKELGDRGVSPNTLAMIHFACTSEDINNLAYAWMSQDTHKNHILPQMKKILTSLMQKTQDYKDAPMLSKTHGQSASPSTMGKELSVFAYRLHQIYKKLQKQEFPGKINGAVGNYNAHYASSPNTPWDQLAAEFVTQVLPLSWNPYTTQIENHDGLAAWCQLIAQYQTISLDLVRDLWGYISLGYFKQISHSQEVGSSTMPHKINPIDFENAEGNYGLANSLADHFARKLPISRWQRDLSDSTVLRS